MWFPVLPSDPSFLSYSLLLRCLSLSRFHNHILSFPSSLLPLFQSEAKHRHSDTEGTRMEASRDKRESRWEDKSLSWLMRDKCIRGHEKKAVYIVYLKYWDDWCRNNSYHLFPWHLYIKKRISRRTLIPQKIIYEGQFVTDEWVVSKSNKKQWQEIFKTNFSLTFCSI